MAPRPVIGVSAAFERAAWTVWDDIEVNVSQRTYSERIDAAGGLPVLLPAERRPGPPTPVRLLDLLDALVLVRRLGHRPSRLRRPVRPATPRTRGPSAISFELALARAAVERDLPLLGVCRGHRRS